jgi:hypothetical protein
MIDISLQMSRLAFAAIDYAATLPAFSRHYHFSAADGHLAEYATAFAAFRLMAKILPTSQAD